MLSELERFLGISLEKKNVYESVFYILLNNVICTNLRITAKFLVPTEVVLTPFATES
jgi:hypothetical protein